MSVSQRILKREVSLRYMKGKEETSVELLEEILSNQNMNEAYRRVYHNKGASGVDGVTVEELKAHLMEHKDELRAQIRKRKYQPAPALRVEIPKENGKMRKLGIPVYQRLSTELYNKQSAKNSAPYSKSNSATTVTDSDQDEAVKWQLLKRWNT